MRHLPSKSTVLLTRIGGGAGETSAVAKHQGVVLCYDGSMGTIYALLELLYVRIVPIYIAWNQLAHMYVFPDVTMDVCLV